MTYTNVVLTAKADATILAPYLFSIDIWHCKTLISVSKDYDREYLYIEIKTTFTAVAL